MGADDDLIDRADALMRRHRSFIARLPSPPPAAAAPEDPLPVLTEVVSDAMPEPAALLAPLQGEIEKAFSSWLAAALPAVLAENSHQLCGALQAAAQQSLFPQLLETLKNGITREKF